MKYLLLVLALACFSFSLQDRYLTWKDSKKLNWNDFTYVSEDTCYLEEDAMASVWLKMKSFYNPQLNFCIKAVFDMNKSMAIDTLSKELLAHEQGHFDLCELYARKLRRKFDSLLNIGNEDWAIYEKEFAKINKEHVIEQNKYDLETNHSTNKTEQKKWNLYIEENLLSLDKYKDTIVASTR